jgi:hypothetical protein
LAAHPRPVEHIPETLVEFDLEKNVPGLLERSQILLQESLEFLLFHPKAPAGLGNIQNGLPAPVIPVGIRGGFPGRHVSQHLPEILEVFGQIFLDSDFIFLDSVDQRIDLGRLILIQVQSLGQPKNPKSAEIIPHLLAEHGSFVLSDQGNKAEKKDRQNKKKPFRFHRFSPKSLFPGRFHD